MKWSEFVARRAVRRPVLAEKQEDAILSKYDMVREGSVGAIIRRLETENTCQAELLAHVEEIRRTLTTENARLMNENSRFARLQHHDEGMAEQRLLALTKLEQENTSLNKEIKRLTCELESAECDRDRLQADFESEVAENARLNNEINTLSAQVIEARAEADKGHKAAEMYRRDNEHMREVQRQRLDDVMDENARWQEALPLYVTVPNAACAECWKGEHGACRNPDKPELPAADEQGFGGKKCPCRYGACGHRVLRTAQGEV